MDEGKRVQQEIGEQREDLRTGSVKRVKDEEVHSDVEERIEIKNQEISNDHHK